MTRGPLHWFCALALLSAGLLFAPGAAGATAGGPTGRLGLWSLQ
jgi:hypothetical protein